VMGAASRLDMFNRYPCGSPPVRDGSNPKVRVQSVWCIAYNHPSLRLVVNRTSWSTVLCSEISGLGEALAMVFH
jgi:hypothetical protein